MIRAVIRAVVRAVMRAMMQAVIQAVIRAVIRAAIRAVIWAVIRPVIRPYASAGNSGRMSVFIGSYPISFVRAWCMLCFIDHQVWLIPPTSSEKGRTTAAKRERECTKSWASQPASVLPTPRQMTAPSLARPPLMRVQVMPAAVMTNHGISFCASPNAEILNQPSRSRRCRSSRKAYVEATGGRMPSGGDLLRGRRVCIALACSE